ncbi:MAG: ABC transporter permease subunit [Micromonosporaceae bacterium]|nr:ABC transporter permease subunit [Micromonosporaceae bacterium]
MSSLDGAAATGWTALAVSRDSPPNPWFSWDYVRDNSPILADALGEHLLLTGVSVVFAVLIGVPLGIVAYRISWLAGPIVGTSGVLYTIPSLALFALIYPFTGFGYATVLIGLVAYALLIIVRNTLTGLQQVSRDVLDAAAGMGHSRRAMLARIELPLALPGILTGLRIATVSTVAMVTVGVIVGVGGLGQLILEGFRANEYRAQIATATVLVVGLALVLDLLLAGAGRLLTPWAKGRSR